MWLKNIRTATAYWIGWLVCMCLIFYADTIDDYKNAEKVKTQVVRVLEKAVRNDRGHYPEFEFTYKDSSYLFAESRGFFVSRWHLGDNATAIFPSGEPDKAEIYGLLSYWVSLTKLFFGFMIAFFVFVIPVFFKWYAEFKQQYK